MLARYYEVGEINSKLSKIRHFAYTIKQNHKIIRMVWSSDDGWFTISMVSRKCSRSMIENDKFIHRLCMLFCQHLFMCAYNQRASIPVAIQFVVIERKANEKECCTALDNENLMLPTSEIDFASVCQTK